MEGGSTEKDGTPPPVPTKKAHDAADAGDDKNDSDHGHGSSNNHHRPLPTTDGHEEKEGPKKRRKVNHGEVTHTMTLCRQLLFGSHWLVPEECRS